MIAIFRFLGLAVGLALCGAVLAVVGALVGGNLLVDDLFASFGLALLGILIGYVLGNTVGIILIRQFIIHHGSVLLGILGIIVGVVIATVLGVTVSPVFFYVGFGLVPVLCLAGFYLKRQ